MKFPLLALRKFPSPTPIEPFGRGVFTRRRVRRGQVLARIYGKPAARQTIFTLQIDEGRHILPEFPARYLNHSCDANAYLRVIDGSVYLCAKRSLPADTHVTLNYGTLEHVVATKGRCLCGSQRCLGKILGYDQQTAEWQRRNRNFVLPFLRRPAAARPKTPAKGRSMKSGTAKGPGLKSRSTKARAKPHTTKGGR